MTVVLVAETPPELALPPSLAAIVAGLPDKDRLRLTEALADLHRINSRLWDAEDQAHAPGGSDGRIADTKRQIDELNAQRNRRTEQADEILSTLSHAEGGIAPATETLGAALDRLSVQTLRLWHTQRAAAAGDSLAERRLTRVSGQITELRTAIDTLTADVTSGRRRLPFGARFKLYGTSGTDVLAPIRPARPLRVIAFGGLSECGKSTSAQFVAHTFGAQRLKMGYLLRQAGQRHGLSDPYQLSAARQAELLLEQLVLFADGHRDISLCTIESVHDDASIRELKQLLGESLQIVYLDAPFEVRVSRSGATAHAVTAKDEVKRSRGAHRVRDLADHVILNTGSVLDLRARLTRIAAPAAAIGERLLVELPAAGALPATIEQPTLTLVRELRLAGTGVKLAALTGSPTTGPWIPGWSDLDLLIIADHVFTPAVIQAVTTYRHDLAGAAPVGLTLISPAEVLARRYPARLAYTLHQIRAGQPVLYSDPSLILPDISRDHVAAAALPDLALVMTTLRRLRSEDEPRHLRQLYKHVVLALRLALFEHGLWPDGTTAIMTAAEALPGMPDLRLPALEDVAAAWTRGALTEPLPDVVIAADRLLGWYAAQLAA